MKKLISISEETTAASIWAFFEVAFTTLLSLVPLFLVAYYQFVTQNDGQLPAPTDPKYIPITEFIYNNTAAGQLAFYAIGNWIAIAWVCSLEKGVHIPMRPLFIALCIVGFAYCGILIGITAEKSYIPSSAVTGPSLWLYGASILCYLLTLIFARTPPPSAEHTNITEAADLHRRVNSLRGTHHG